MTSQVGSATEVVLHDCGFPGPELLVRSIVEIGGVS